jgi:uncharacterized protein
MMQFQDLSDASYIAVETFRKNGKGVKTPVWFTTEGDKHYCWTVADSGKVKRIRNNPQINLAKCNARGELESDWVSVTAKVLDSPVDVTTQKQRMLKKYGFMFRLFQLMGMIQRSKNVAIEFSNVILDQP